MAGHPSHDPENQHEEDQRTTDGSSHAPKAVALTAFLTAPGHTLGELADTDHAHGGGPAAGLEPATSMAPDRRQPARGGPTLSVLAPAFTGRRHRPSLPRSRPIDGRPSLRSTRP